MNPEKKARRNIDDMLEASGWRVQNYAGHDTSAALGVAVREYPLKSDQRADYLLFVNGTAVGVIEAKPEGTTLSGALQQAERYRASLPDNLRRLPRFAMGESAFLEPFSVSVDRRFIEWLAGQTFTAEQQLWLEMIRDHIATSLDIRIEDFEYAPFAELGNGAKVYELFGDNLDNILKDLTEKLVS